MTVFDAESLTVGQLDFDKPIKDAEHTEDDWDEEFDGEGIDDTWEFHDAESNESSVTLSSSSTKRTYGEVEADDEPEYGGGAATGTLSRMSSIPSCLFRY